jgi:hypothetical protein
MNGRIDAIAFLAKVAFVGILGLGTSACGEPVAEQLATLDLVSALRPEGPPETYVRVIRAEGTLELCATGESFDLRALRGQHDESGTCAAFPLQYAHREGAFPYVEVVVDETAYPANEVHLARRAGVWFLFIEGGVDEYAVQKHDGAVFQILREAGDPVLGLRCTGHTEAWGEDTDTWGLYEWLDEKGRSLDIQLVNWTGADSCVIDYSISDENGAA